MDKNDTKIVESEDIFRSCGAKSTESIDRFSDPFQGNLRYLQRGHRFWQNHHRSTKSFQFPISLESTEVNNGVPKDTSSGRNL